jgi:hypothetical protein
MVTPAGKCRIVLRKSSAGMGIGRPPDEMNSLFGHKSNVRIVRSFDA